MSRIGRQVVAIPSGVSIETAASEVRVKGPKGQLAFPLFPEIKVEVADGEARVSPTGAGSNRRASAMRGLVRAHLANMVTGVTEGFQKSLEIVGTGWNAKAAGRGIEMQIGFAHTVTCEPPEGVDVDCPTNTQIVITGIDKQAVGQFAANIRKVRPPEPYKGKGIRYTDEYVRRKTGKSLS